MNIVLPFASLILVCFAGASVPTVAESSGLETFAKTLREAMKISEPTRLLLAERGFELEPDDRDCTWRGSEVGQVIKYLNACWNEAYFQIIHDTQDEVNTLLEGLTQFTRNTVLKILANPFDCFRKVFLEHALQILVMPEPEEDLAFILAAISISTSINVGNPPRSDPFAPWTTSNLHVLVARSIIINGLVKIPSRTMHKHIEFVAMGVLRDSADPRFRAFRLSFSTFIRIMGPTLGRSITRDLPESDV